MDATLKTRNRNVAEKGEDDTGKDQPERQRHRESLVSTRKIKSLPRFTTIGFDEKRNLLQSLNKPLSGYLGGIRTAGYWIERLQSEWSDTFGVTYAVACNSATSGLLAACLAADIGPGDLVWVSDYTMSASASCAMMLGAEVRFLDIEVEYFGLDLSARYGPLPKAIIVTNLFGCPANLIELREFCDLHGIVLIEDNAQAPFASVNGKYCGTIGHIGVFSLNVHKHIQCGEGGVVVTDNPQYAHVVDCSINHGELMRTNPNLGLNLRMTEPIAAIACAQLKKGISIVSSRINLAEDITRLFRGIDFVVPPAVPRGAVHVYYMWAGKIVGGNNIRERREKFLAALQDRGLPFRIGYSKPLHRITGQGDDLEFPMTLLMEDHQLFTFEVCGYDPSTKHLAAMQRIIDKVAAKIK